MRGGHITRTGAKKGGTARRPNLRFGAIQRTWPKEYVFGVDSHSNDHCVFTRGHLYFRVYVNTYTVHKFLARVGRLHWVKPEEAVIQYVRWDYDLTEMNDGSYPRQ